MPNAPAPCERTPFLKACRNEMPERTPIWLMRQIGRYDPAFRKFRAKVPFLRFCKSPDLVARWTVRTAQKLGVDAAIVFSDILLQLEPLGVGLSYRKGEGPRIARPLKSPRDVDRIRDFDLEGRLHFVYEAVREARRTLDPAIPLLGFAGAPFTLASYLIEGESSRDCARTKAFMYGHPEAWHRLLGLLSRHAARHLNAQIGAGAQAVQVFDSWAGTLTPTDYRQYALPHSFGVFARLPKDIPAIHFGTHTAALLEAMREAGGSVIGLDHRVPLDDVRARLGPVPVMGNLDPAALLADRQTIARKAADVLDRNAGRPGHIFNLGHGVLPETPYDNVRYLVDFVHGYQAKHA